MGTCECVCVRDSEHVCVTHVTAVVDKTGQVATFGGINDGVVVDTEQVAAANALLLLISPLPHICDHLEENRPHQRVTNQHSCIQMVCLVCPSVIWLQCVSLNLMCLCCFYSPV